MPPDPPSWLPREFPTAADSIQIAQDGGQYIAHMLMFFKCTMEVLELRGNYLQDVPSEARAKRQRDARELQSALASHVPQAGS